jgi:hypothetical protein
MRPSNLLRNLSSWTGILNGQNMYTNTFTPETPFPKLRDDQAPSLQATYRRLRYRFPTRTLLA